MPSRSPASALIEIRDNIDLALSFVSGLTFETFSGDKKTVYAVIRCLEIISEASRRLPADLKDVIQTFPGLMLLVPEIFIDTTMRTALKA